MASSRMPRLIAWVASVCRSRCRVHARNPGGPGDPAHYPADQVPVQHATMVGDQALVAADVLEVGGGPGTEQLDELGVQGHVAVVAELAQRDPQPVPGADPHHRIGVEIGQLAGPHPFSGGPQPGA